MRRLAPIVSGVSPASVARQLRTLGAIAHFDPSWGASDDGTTSTWIDRIGGYSVASTSQATRLVYSSSIAGLNNRPGWTGLLANSTKLKGAAGLAAILSGLQAYTVFSVRKASSNAAGQIAWSSCNNSSAQYIYDGDTVTTGAASSARRNVGTTDTVTSVVQTGTAPRVEVVSFNGSNSQSIGDNGSLYVSAAVTVSPTCGEFVIGALNTGGIYSLFYSGNIADLVVFPSALSGADRRYIERLFAIKYGWPVLQGLTGFTSANYLACSGNSSGIRGGTSVWADCLIRLDAAPVTANQYLSSAYGGNTGFVQYLSGTNNYGLAGNTTTIALSPARGVTAADYGKLALFGMTAGSGNLVRQFFNGSEIGAGTALTGYSPNSTVPYSVGARAGANACTEFSIFGTAGGSVEQNATDQANRAAAIKAAAAFVASGGATPNHGWALNDVASSYADLIGSDALAIVGAQLSPAQIVMTSWPW